MKKVICFGEAIIDFLQTGIEAEGGLNLNSFTQFPGGAPANVSVAVAKLGGYSSLLGQVGSDQFGDFMLSALNVYGVDTTNVYQHAAAKTAIAYVFRDEFGERSFSFRRNQTADLLMTKDQIRSSMFGSGNIFHFCSNTLTEPGIEKVTEYAVSSAQDQQALVSFDVNLRPGLWNDENINAELINRYVFTSDLIKFAKEELEFLSGGDTGSYIKQCFNANVKAILVSDGANKIRLYTRTKEKHINPPTIKAVDTNGGGDSFIGGVLWGLSKQEDVIDIIGNIDAFSPLIEFAARCGAFTVSKKGAFTAFPLMNEIESVAL